MSEERFDLSFAGELAAGADPDQVRARLAAVFKLNEQSAARLFTGRAVVIKRDADAATRARFEEIFTRAGARLRVTALTPETASDEPSAKPSRAPPAGGPSDDAPETTSAPSVPLAIGPDTGFLEPPRKVDLDAFDTSAFSLVADKNWTLADCSPPQTAAPTPDTSHLSMAEIEPTHQRKDFDE